MKVSLKKSYEDLMDLVGTEYKFGAIENLNSYRMPVSLGMLCDRHYGPKRYLGSPSHMRDCLDEFAALKMTEMKANGLYTVTMFGRSVLKVINRNPVLRNISYSGTGNREYNEERVLLSLLYGGQITKPKISEATGVSGRTLTDSLKKLRDDLKLVWSPSEGKTYLKILRNAKGGELNGSEEAVYRTVVGLGREEVTFSEVAGRVQSGTLWYGKKGLVSKGIMAQRKKGLNFGLTSLGKVTASAINEINDKLR